MTEFDIALAGVPLRVRALHPSTQRFCADYLCDEEPAFSVTICQDDIDAERAISAQADEAQGVPVRGFSDAYLETLAVYRKVARELLAFDAVVFHGSALAVGGRTYLFAAPSGTGKTTHTRYWLQAVPGAHVLNGDKPLLRMVDGRVMACGTPWQGKENFGRNEMLPLEAICLLERDTRSLPMTVRPWDTPGASRPSAT